MPNYCTNCGIPLNPTWNACPECGTLFRKTAPAYIPPKIPVYTPPKIIKLPLIFKIIYIGFAAILIISLFLPYMHVSPYHYLYPDGNIYGFTSPFLIGGTIFTIVSIILTFGSKIKHSIIFGLLGCGLGLLTLYDTIYSTTNPHPGGWFAWIGIGFYIGLISIIGLGCINLGILIFYLLKNS